MKTNTKRVIVTLLIAITYLVVDEYFVNERFIVFDASLIIPFIVFCFLVYAVIFGIWDTLKEKGFLKTVGIIILVIFWIIFTNLEKINRSQFCTNNPYLPLCSRSVDESEVNS